MKIKVMSFVLACVLASFAGVTLAQQPTSATAQIINKQGDEVGQATFTADGSGGVRLQVTLNNFAATPGEHGIHIHQTGQCNLPDFQSAGGHFNPTGAQHGLENPQGPHAGDLPNLQLSDAGDATYETTTTLVSFEQGSNLLLDADGSALVIHSGADDQVTDPAGNSGDRIACGVIVAGSGGAEAAPSNLPATGDETFPNLMLPVLGSGLLLAGLWLRWQVYRRPAK